MSIRKGLAIRDIEAAVGPDHTVAVHRDLHADEAFVLSPTGRSCDIAVAECLRDFPGLRR